ncbi:MAG TPA: DivIVA domain-containing protein [Acidimicrobiales bacterium]|nr:DivIVA domain-containing protein [Acidimicrobiales bacterium]
MEISARVLREVEFNSSLRGYNTDEVDEFLEQVADGVDRLQAEAKTAAERVESAERSARDRVGADDEDSLRRTLVLAQRTADLAIKEAQEEAGQILDRARGEAETLVGDARDSAQRMTSEAERRLRDEVARLTTARDALRTEIDTLVSLLGAERERLTESLSAALGYVERSLVPSPALTAHQNVKGASEAPAAGGPEGGGGGGGKASRGGGGGGGGSGGGGGKGSAEHSKESETEATVPVSERGPAEGRKDSGADDEDDEDDEPGGAGAVDEADDLEAGIAEDAAAAAPAEGSRASDRVSGRGEQYDWDSVIRGKAEPLFGDRPRGERSNLTAVPSSDDTTHDTATLQIQAGGPDWPA